MTTLAVAVLLLDGILLAIAGIALDNAGFLWGSAACGLVALLVVYGWRRYARTISEVDAERQEIRRDAESLRDLLRKHNLNN